MRQTNPYKGTTTEAELRRLIEREGLSFGEVAKRLRINPSMVGSACSVLGIRSTAARGRAHDLDAYRNRLRRGEQVADIAKSLGMPTMNVYMALRRAGYPTTVAAADDARSGVDIDAIHRRAA